MNENLVRLCPQCLIEGKIYRNIINVSVSELTVHSTTSDNCSLSRAFKMSSDIAWAVTRNNSAFLLKKRGCPKPFSTDPMNLTNKNSQRYNGYLHKKALGVSAIDKGFALTVKKPSRANRPGRSTQRTEMKSGARTSLSKVRNQFPI